MVVIYCSSLIPNVPMMSKNAFEIASHYVLRHKCTLEIQRGMMCKGATDLPVPLIHDPCDLYLLPSHLGVLLGLSDTPRISEKHESLSAFTPLAHCTPLFLLESFSLTLFLSASFSSGVHTTTCESEWVKEREKERRNTEREKTH